MQLFYSNIANFVNQTLDIGGQEHVHISKSLRKKEGDLIFVGNGLGKIFEAEIISVNKSETIIRLKSIVKQEVSKQNFYLAAAPTKNIDRYEWMLEKSVELGLAGLYPFFSQNSERRNLKTDKLQLQAIGAMKQSLQTYLPQVFEPQKFEYLLKSVAHFQEKYIAFSSDSNLKLKNSLKKDIKTIVLIGPEGGFTEKELNLALQYGFIAVSLGKNRLRTETAGVFATSLHYSLYEE